MADISNVKMKDAEGKDVTYRITEIENGFIICCEKNWEEDGEYKYEEKKYFSEDNPFAEQADNMYDIMKSAIGES